MKSTIESSVYCVIIVIACYLFIGFVRMNMDVNKVNEVTKYVQDYMEVHGKSTGDDSTGYALDQTVLDQINAHTGRFGMSATVTYDTATENYVYYKLQVSYGLKMPFLKINSSHTYDAIARTAKTT